MTNQVRAGPLSDRDPLVWCWFITLAFFLLAMVRIGIPLDRHFDENFYIPAAARLLLGIDVINQEHPMLAKTLMSGGLALFGNQPPAWRIGSLVSGSLGLLCAMRALWWYAGDRRATILFGLLLASHGLLFALSRIAMLDAYMFGFAAWAVMLFAQRSFAASGAAFGLALACKWSVVPLLAFFGCLALYRNRNWRPFVWFGAIPLVVYFASFWPGFLVQNDPFTIGRLLPLQLEMAQFLGQPMRAHPYGSNWWHWVSNTMPMWLVHNEIDGAYRLIVMGGNPLSSLAIVPAVALALWKGGPSRLPALAYAVCLGFWMVSGKSVQYYYHYLFASTFGLATIALLLARSRLAVPFTGAVLGLFVWLYPAMTGAPTDRSRDAQYTALPGWQFRDTPAPQRKSGVPPQPSPPVPEMLPVK